MSKPAKAAKAARDFPGGGVVPAPGELRVAIEKKPYAEIIGHAVLQPDVEVCGVLVGRHATDAHGSFLHITHAIRGEAAKQEGAQVTFTHETWNHIHKEMDQKFPDDEIVGWYHTHGGFGIFLSDMDAFIHRNFFSAPHQVAYVYDPLAGTEGFFHDVDGTLKQVKRYWLGGREKKPLGAPEVAPAATTGEAGGQDLGPAVLAMGRAAVAIQQSLDRSRETMPWWAWPAFAAVAVLLGYVLWTGPLGGRGGPRSTTMVLVHSDPQTGMAFGTELIPLQHLEGQGPVYADMNGVIHPAVTVAQLNEVLQRYAPPQPAATTPEPPAALNPPTAAAATGGVSRTMIAVAMGAVALLAAGGIGAVLLMRRKRQGAKHG